MSKKNSEIEYRDYGVEEFVPDKARHYGFMDMISTWVGANCQPNTWYIGGCLAASGFAIASGVILIANPLSYIILALVGFMAYKIPTTSMGLIRFSFGIRGSRFMAAIHTITQIGWAAVGSYLGSVSLSYMFNAMWGWPCYGMEGSTWVLALGILICSGLTGIFVCLGGSKSVKLAENIAVVAMTVLSIWITYAVLKTFPLSEVMSWKPAEDVAMPLGVGIDSIAAYSLGWVICVAEFTRYTKTKKAATVAPVIGATIGICWFALVGTIAVIASALTTGVFDPNTSDPSSVAATLGLGFPAFLVILLSVVTTTMISMFCCSASALNVVPKKIPNKKMNYYIAVICTVCSFLPLLFNSFLDFFYAFMDLLGLVFPPLAAIMIVDYYLIRKKKYIQEEISNKEGPYWYKNGINIYAILGWIVGVAAYLIFKSVGVVTSSIGAVFPAMLAAGIAYYVFGKIGVSKGAYRDVTVEGK